MSFWRLVCPPAAPGPWKHAFSWSKTPSNYDERWGVTLGSSWLSRFWIKFQTIFVKFGIFTDHNTMIFEIPKSVSFIAVSISNEHCLESFRIQSFLVSFCWFTQAFHPKTLIWRNEGFLANHFSSIDLNWAASVNRCKYPQKLNPSSPQNQWGSNACNLRHCAVSMFLRIFSSVLPCCSLSCVTDVWWTIPRSSRHFFRSDDNFSPPVSVCNQISCLTDNPEKRLLLLF